MRVKIKFVDGPLHGELARTESLDEHKVFFNDRDRMAIVYTRQIDATEYHWNAERSKKVTEKYDLAKSFHSEPQVEAFIAPDEPDDASMAENVKFSDDTIEPGDFQDDDEDELPPPP